MQPTKLAVVKASANSQTIDQVVVALEQSGGNLDRLFEKIPTPNGQDNFLFTVYQALALPENDQWRERWDKALDRSTTIRMRLLECKALTLFENYKNPSDSSAAGDIAFFKTIMLRHLVESTESVKSRYRPALPLSPAPPEANAADPMGDLEDEFDAAEKA